MNIDPHRAYRGKDVTQFTVFLAFEYKVYADIRGVLGQEASNDSGVIENVDFQGVRTLRLWHLRK